MKHYVFSRLLQLIPILFVITFLSFAMMRLAGSDVVLQSMERTGMAASDAVVAAARAELGLDKPFLTQYFTWLGKLLHGDMGRSYVSGRPVFETFIAKLPATLLLTGVSVGLTLLVSLPLGVFSAVNQNRWGDWVIRSLSFVGNSIPNFFAALLLLYIFAIQLQWLPVISRQLTVESVILPASTLALAMSAKYIRQVRATVLDELSKDYVLAARARGIPFAATLIFSVLRSSLVTIITLLMLSIGSLLGGTAIVESIFMWDGVGKLAVDAINMRDYPMIQAYVMWMAIIYVCVNLMTDLSYQWLDPRIVWGGESHDRADHHARCRAAPAKDPAAVGVLCNCSFSRIGMPYCALFRMDCAIRSQCTDLCLAFAAFLGALGRDRPLRARPLFAHSGGTAHQHFCHSEPCIHHYDDRHHCGDDLRLSRRIRRYDHDAYFGRLPRIPGPRFCACNCGAP